jgi:ankyrin repeat protein
MTEKLLEAGADVFAVDSSLGTSALHKAAQSGVIDVARLLLNKGAFINFQSATVGHTPLIDAIWSKKPGMVQFLLEQGASTSITTHYGGTAFDFIGADVLWTAGFTIPENEAWGKEIRETLQLFKTKAEKSVSSQALMQAVMANNLEDVKNLIASGADVNEKSPVVGSGNDGQTPLLVACFNGFKEIVAELLTAGADAKIVDYLLKATPLHKAAYAGHPEPIRLLLEQGKVEANAQGPYNGYTALHDSVWHGHKDAMEALLEGGVKRDLKGHDGRTPLDLAVALGYGELAEILGMSEFEKNAPISIL